jgi:FkbH-like protein
MNVLTSFGLHQYFLYPQINWRSKVVSIRAIAASLNIDLDAFSFIDDQPFELEEVKFSLPEVLCLDVAERGRMLDMPEFCPRFLTPDSKMRRQMYLGDALRQQAEGEFDGTKEDFLATLNMVFTVSTATRDDLQRAEELTVRTNQLNTTGYTYSYDELDYFRQSSDYKLLIASLDDRFGSHGKIGIALLRCDAGMWTIKLLLMSCRVMSRGVGMIMLNHLMQLAKREQVGLRAEFCPNERNRMMYVTLRFAGFKEVAQVNGATIYENDLSRVQSFPEYVRVVIDA